ncbi:MAG: patatin-like phospholipase family protein [Acidimicrobiia bacterium]|nr:MAG: patatin-like phospholipase family protein [Acidimicrobiia bacterium]
MNAFVLTGGGSLGAVHVGMLRALYERGIAPDLIVGTSVGAINGAFIASRPQSPETARSLGDIWHDLRRSQVFPMDLVGGFLGFVGLRKHFVSNRGLRKLVEDYAGFVDLADAAIPLHIIATDAASGQEVALVSGNTIDAVLASAALPGIYPPIEWEGRHLVDGGVSNYAPISHAIDGGAQTIYVLASGTACGLRVPPKGAIPILLHSMSFLVTGRFVVEVGHLQERANLVVLPPPCPLNVPSHDFSQADALIAGSYETAGLYLDEVEATGLAPIPEHLLRIGPHHSEAL